MIGMLRNGRIAFAILPFVLGSGGPLAEEMLYYVEDDQVVFTNVPSRRGAEPVPGFAKPSPDLGSDPAGNPYESQIRQAARESGLSPTLVRAVVRVESGFDSRAVSPKGARGLMQLMPATASRYGVRDAFDPLENLRAGTRYLRHLMDEFGDLRLALAAYNAGPGVVRRHGGVPAYAETRAYVRRVRRELGHAPSHEPAPAAAFRVPESDGIRVQRGADGALRFVN